MDTAINRKRQRWLWIAGTWSAIGLFEATETVFGMHAQGMHHYWNALFLTVALSWLPWALVTPFVLDFGSKYPLKALTCVIHLALAISVHIAATAWFAWLTITLNPFASPVWPGPFTRVWLVQFNSSLLSSIMVYAGIIAVAHTLGARTRLAWQEAETARLNEQLSKAQFEALRRQIEPHFLFNALNSISALIRDQQNDAAVHTIARLSELLRRVIEDPKRQLVTLAEEMDFSRNYVEIQKVRFAERLQLNVDVPIELLSAQVPSLVLQPIIENAVVHGISRRAQGGAIRISGTRTNEMLTLKVYNDGPSFPAAPRNSSGVGMANIRARLHSLYGDNFYLRVSNQEPQGVEVALSLPYREG